MPPGVPRDMEKETEDKEKKVVYRDGDRVRAIRGIVEKGDFFITVKRRDGDVEINKNEVLRIEPNGEVSR